MYLIEGVITVQLVGSAVLCLQASPRWFVDKMVYLNSDREKVRANKAYRFQAALAYDPSLALLHQQ